MKRWTPFLLVLTLALASACGGAETTATPTIAAGALETRVVETAYASLTETAMQSAYTGLTQIAGVPTMLAQTPTPTATSTPTVDYSVITFSHLFVDGTEETVVVFKLNGASGDFTLMGNEHTYFCKPQRDDPDILICRGVFQPVGYHVTYILYVEGNPEPIMTREMVIPFLYPPTPVGMNCEIEPLWVAPLTGPYGCYAVTCYIGSTYYDGTTNTCENPWTWPVP